MQETDVLIVGAGPTGLMLANQLARRGVRTLIIDRHAGPARETRALGVQARTLEIYAELGIVEHALALGKPALGAQIWSRGRRAAHVPLGDIGRQMTPYPYLLILGQDDNERILGERLQSWGLSVRWRTELVDLAQHRDHAAATIRDPDGGTRQLTAAWVAGCDGAQSAVRELNAIPFAGAPYEHVFFVADTVATGDMEADTLSVYLWPQGFHLFFPMRGKNHWRIAGILPDALRERDDPDFDAVLPSLRGEAGSRLAVTACEWFSTYRIHHRAAARFRDRRCFLLGDAAHIHSPVGAQGMNTGLQDAYNLAWKLALVVQGQADAELLDSYAAEREPVARQLLETTDRAFRLIVSERRIAGLLRTRVLPRFAALAMRRAWLQRIIFRRISQIGIHYRNSPLSESVEALPRTAPKAGDRFPWLQLAGPDGDATHDLFAPRDDTRPMLVVVGQPAPPTGALKHAALIQLYAVAQRPGNDAVLARAGVPSPAYFLLRPDGHIGLCGRRLDPQVINRYLRRIGFTSC